MSISINKPSIRSEDILVRVSELDILNYYFGINNIPCVVTSPLRPDNHPSFGFNSPDGKRIYWTDLATKDRGGIFDLLSNYWGKSYDEVLTHIWEDLPKISKSDTCKSLKKPRLLTVREHNSLTDLQCKIRDWKSHDLEYWGSYGITLQWLKYADIYPVSYKIIIKEGTKIVLPTDKYAYAYVERKEGKITLKIYQPFNKSGYKWSNKHDRSVISLWTKVPEFGDKLCICASMKDALCLWANTGIPAIAIQGEGYSVSNTAITELKRRYKEVFILLDNDNAGLIDGERLAAHTGFKNIILPQFNGGKDISDFFKSLQDKKKFKQQILKLFNNE